MYDRDDFEWDEAKRIANFRKHGLDFIDAVHLFDGRPALQIPADSQAEPRLLTVALLNGRFVTLIWTWRGTKRRAISLRRSRDAERDGYRQLFD